MKSTSCLLTGRPAAWIQAGGLEALLARRTRGLAAALLHWYQPLRMWPSQSSWGWVSGGPARARYQAAQEEFTAGPRTRPREVPGAWAMDDAGVS